MTLDARGVVDAHNQCSEKNEWKMHNTFVILATLLTKISAF